tara:strand:+ start:212 stop:415 length:204 start_codon:yes stop_codon:yes gene_type:complete
VPHTLSQEIIPGQSLSFLSLQEVEPLIDDLPFGQSLHTLAPSEEIFPTGQSLHSINFDKEYVPAKHI